MRDRLTIGEVAKLTGVTTKTVRHYHQVGLLAEPDRSESGYRLYGAGELLRLQRIRQLKAFGLPLKKIKAVLGEPGGERSLREAFSKLYEEVSAEIEVLEGRRRRLEELLAQEELEISIGSSEEPYAIKLVEEHLGEHLSEISPEVWEQERKMWTDLDAFEWPDGYKEMQELITFYYADRPGDFREMLAISERLAALAKLPEDSPEVERLAEDFVQHLKQTPFPYDPLEGSPLMSGAIGEVFTETLLTNLSPAQRRAIELVQKRFEKGDEP